MTASDDPTAPAIVLPEHRFAQPVSGPAYTAWARFTTASTVASLLLYGGQVLLRRPDVAWPVLMLMAAGGGVLLLSTWYILTGKTTIDGRGIRQDWLTPKEFGWHEIARVRLVRMPLVPRLVVMTGRGPLKAVHGGSRALVEAFREIDTFYRQ
ncbi:MAG: hypothetical protein KAY46_13650 [Burkholderiaceae bacterium]|nr:hypothetical protein [Burkholderiaceae bacterium]